MKRAIRKHEVILVALLLLTSVLTAAKEPKQSPPLSNSMTLEQARHALLSAAGSLFVPLPGKVYQAIVEKSMRVSATSAQFSGFEADKYNGGKHRYRILFTTFESVSVKCNSTTCTVASQPPGTLARNESGEALGDFHFNDVHREDGTYRTTCSAECHQIARDFAAALNALHTLAVNSQAASVDFHQQAAAWRALNPKPPIPEEVREQRLLAEDAVKNNKPGEALDFFEAGLELYPTWPQGHFNAALIAAELDLYGDAVEHMQAYLELLPDAPDAQSARDQILIWRHKAK